MFLNLGSDVPFIYTNDKFVFFDRKNLENQLPQFFYDNKDKLNSLYVITWPWYFSSTRVGVEVVNILKVLWIFKNIYFLDKIIFFKKLWFRKLYLFSWNKNKFLDLETDNIISKKDLNPSYKMEELFELEAKNMIFYKDIIKNYKDIKWNKLWENTLLKPFYIFDPIIC